MTKEEFLSVLRGRITGHIPTREVESQIDYYSAYIDGRIGAGFTEEEAVAELGDPLLIAKTVIASVDRAAEEAGYDGPYRSSTDTYDDSDGINSGIFGKSGPTPGSDSSYAGNTYSGAQNQTGSAYREPTQRTEEKGKTFSAGSLGCIIAVIIFVLIMALGWVLVMFVFRVSFALLGWLLPVVAVIAIIALVISRTRRR